MDYNRIYNNLVTRAAGRVKSKSSSPSYVYYEKHHIVPMCVGGENNRKNLVLLTAEEHWLAHLLLVKMYPGNPKLVFACQAMTMTGGNNKRMNNKLFGWIRRAYAEKTSERQSGRTLPDATKEKISNALKGKPTPHQIGDLNVSKRPEVAAKISAANKGRKLGARSDEVKKKISLANKGHAGLLGDKNPASWRVCCIHCQKETALPNLTRDHRKCGNELDTYA